MENIDNELSKILSWTFTNKNNIEKFSDTDYANYTRTLSQTCTHANDCVYPLDYRSNYNCFSDCKKTCLGE